MLAFLSCTFRFSSVFNRTGIGTGKRKPTGIPLMNFVLVFRTLFLMTGIGTFPNLSCTFRFPVTGPKGSNFRFPIPVSGIPINLSYVGLHYHLNFLYGTGTKYQVPGTFLLAGRLGPRLCVCRPYSEGIILYQVLLDCVGSPWYSRWTTRYHVLPVFTRY